MKAKNRLVAMGLVGLLSLLPVRASSEEPSVEETLADINRSAVRSEGVFSELKNSLDESKTTGNFLENMNLEKAVNFVSLYRGLDEKSSEKYRSKSFNEEFTGNLIENLDRDIVFISQIEAEKVISKENEFLYSKQVWDAFTDTAARRWDIGRWFDELAKKVQTVTTLSYTSKKAGIRARLGPYFSDELGIYTSLGLGSWKAIAIADRSEVRFGIERIFGKKYIGNTLGYAEATLGENEDKLLFLLKKTF